MTLKVGVRWASEYTSISSSRIELARNKPNTPFATNHFSAAIRPVTSQRPRRLQRRSSLHPERQHGCGQSRRSVHSRAKDHPAQRHSRSAGRPAKSSASIRFDVRPEQSRRQRRPNGSADGQRRGTHRRCAFTRLGRHHLGAGRIQRGRFAQLRFQASRQRGREPEPDLWRAKSRQPIRIPKLHHGGLHAARWRQCDPERH